MSLSVAGLTVRAGGRALVDAVDLTAGAGRVTGLVGPNGAGKSTLLRAVLGLLKPDAGAIAFAGTDLLALPRRRRARLMAHVAQDSATEARLTARDVVLLGRIPFQSAWSAEPSAADFAIADAAMAAVGMADFASRAFHTLSGGEQQRLHIARALTQQPQLLVLDEPTSHLDIEAQLAVLALLRARAAAGLTVLIVLHDLNLAAGFCDDLAVLHRGRMVAQGAPGAILTPALLRAVYGVGAILVPHPATGRPIIAYPA